ncbi:MAG: hypothetical protein ABI777_11650, partial [Betaproteobacteria bacterium]
QKEVQSAAQDLKSSVETAARGAESGLKSVEEQLNESAPESVAADTSTLPLFEPAPLGGEPGGELADAAPAAPARQASLPGFDKI